ncbi:hypothetical protein [Streptomyces omiyaensis]|uniref:hypothetical protein n=1 Tax=Streptomyces omiyaensis TaxID=68247 RepID=UPI0036FB09FC
MAKTIEDLSSEIAALKEALLYDQTTVLAKYDTDHQVKDPDKQPKDEVFWVSKIKSSLIDERPRIVTDAMLPFDFVPRFAEMYEELQKEKSTELLEAFGLDGIASAVEKFHEGHEARREYLAVAIAGILVPMAIGALVIVFRKAILTGFRELQYRLAPDSKAFALNDGQTWFQRMTKDQIKTREDAAAGVTAGDPPNPEDLGPLKQALGDINRRIINFNKAVAQMKTKGQLERLAKGVEAVTKATDLAKPTEIETLAAAIDKLGDAQDKFNPRDVPKPRPLKAAADAAQSLADAGQSVSERFAKLKEDATELVRIMSGGSQS